MALTTTTALPGPVAVTADLSEKQSRKNDTIMNNKGSLENNNNSHFTPDSRRRQSALSSLSIKSTAACQYNNNTTNTNEMVSYSQKEAEVQQKTVEVLRAEHEVETEAGTVNGDGGGDAHSTTTAPNAASGSDELISKRTTYFLLALLCLTNACLSMNSSLIAPFFPNEVLDKGGTAFLSGLIISAFDGTRFFLAPVFGNCIYAIGPRFMLLAGPFVFAWCSMLFGLNGNSPPGATFFTLATLVRIASGAGSSMFNVTAVAVRPILFRGYTSLAMSLIRAAVTLGIIVGPAFGGVLYSLGGFGLPFWVLGGIALCISIVQMRVIPDLTALERAHKQAAAAVQQQQKSTQETVVVRKATFIKMFTTPGVSMCLLMYWAFGFVTMFYAANISLHATPLVGSVAKVGYIILIAGVAEICVSPFVGIALDRGAPARVTVLIGFALCAIGLLLMGPTPLIPWMKTSLWLVIVGTVIYGIGIGFGITGPYNLAAIAARAQGFPPTQQTFGLIAGCMSTAFTCGCFLGPLTGGAMHDKLGFPWSATIVAGGLCIIMLMMIANSIVRWCRRHRQQRHRRKVDVDVNDGKC